MKYFKVITSNLLASSKYSLSFTEPDFDLASEIPGKLQYLLEEWIQCIMTSFLQLLICVATPSTHCFKEHDIAVQEQGTKLSSMPAEQL